MCVKLVIHLFFKQYKYQNGIFVLYPNYYFNSFTIYVYMFYSINNDYNIRHHLNN